MKLRSSEFIDRLWDGNLEKVYYQYIDQFNLSTDNISATLFRPGDGARIPCSIHSLNAFAITRFGHIANIDGIIEHIEARIYIPGVQVYATLIDVGYDEQKVSKFYEFVLKHEFGHIVDNVIRFEGKPIVEYESYHEKCKEAAAEWRRNYECRTNASVYTRLKLILSRFSIIGERDANQCVGITDEDIIRAESLRYGLSDIQVNNLIKKLLNQEGHNEVKIF